MAVEILETLVSETAEATVVQLFVSDTPRAETGGSFRLDLLVTLPRYKAPILLAQAQREALKLAGKTLTPLLEELGSEIERARKTELRADPEPKK
jgi:hypothetical protein